MLSEAQIMQLATSQITDSELEATTIHKHFRTSYNPKEAFVYEDLPSLAL